MKQILGEQSPGEIRWLLLEEEKAIALAIERASAMSHPRPGEIWRLQVTKAAPTAMGYFATADQGQTILLRGRSVHKLTEGQKIQAKISRAAVENKSAIAKLVTDPKQKELGPLGLLKTASTVMEGWLKQYRTELKVVMLSGRAEFGALVEARCEPIGVQYQFSSHPDEIGAKLDDTFEFATKPVFGLDVGGRVTLERSEIGWLFDVDSAGAGVGQNGKIVELGKLNLAAMGKIATVINLVNLGGTVMIDLAGNCEPPAFRKIARRLRERLRDDLQKQAKIELLTTRGIAGIFLPVIHPPLWDLLASRQKHDLQSGWANSSASQGLGYLRHLYRNAQRTAPATSLELSPPNNSVGNWLKNSEYGQNAIQDFSSWTGVSPTFFADL